MTDLKTALWCDLTTDEERSAWLLLGRGYETGVVAKSMQNDLARAYQRLAQSELEPVAWVSNLPGNKIVCSAGLITTAAWVSNLPGNKIAIKIAGTPTEGNWEPLYTAPPRKEWQGLTEEEIGTIIGDSKITLVNYCSADKQTEYARVIEQTLKDKNA